MAGLSYLCCLIYRDVAEDLALTNVSCKLTADVCAMASLSHITCVALEVLQHHCTRTSAALVAVIER
jgi:hypothetical protein